MGSAKGLLKMRLPEFKIEDIEDTFEKVVREKIIAITKQKERQKISNKKYRQTPKGKKVIKESLRKAQRKYYWKNYLTNKQYSISIRLRNLLHHALKYYTKTGKIYSSSKYGIDYKAIIKHLKPFPNDLSKFHIDHIKPLCSFNLEDSKQIKEAFAPENHQWLLARDNMIKGGK